MKNKTYGYFPMFTDISQKKILVIGGGKVAERRVHTLLDFAENITVVAPDICEEIQKLVAEKQIVFKQKAYEREDLYDADLVVAATDKPEINNDVYSACKCLGITVNTASDKNKCDFHFPGVIEHEGVVIGFNAAGMDHKKTKEVREKVEALLKEEQFR